MAAPTPQVSATPHISTTPPVTPTPATTPRSTGRATPHATSSAARTARPRTRTAQTMPKASGTTAAAQARVEQRPCPLRLPAGTLCGVLVVPERRDLPSGRTIKVGYAVHYAEGPARKADPVVYMGGGPGASSEQVIPFLAGMLPDRDVVAIEQRGGQYSEPRLQCPEIAKSLVQVLQTTGQAAQENALLAENGLACRTRLAQQVSLAGYRTSEIAADVVDLRKALGYPKWNLLGVSYSTRVMLQVAARDPQGTRSVVLDSLAPGRVGPDGDGWPRLAATIAKLGITARFDAMVARLNAKPVSLTTRDPLTGGEVTLVLDGADAATILAESLQEPGVIPIIPALVDGVAGGRTALLQALVDGVGDELSSHEWGLYYAVKCQDQRPAAPQQGTRPLFTDSADAAVCSAWPAPEKTAVASPSTGTAATGTKSGTGGKTADRANAADGKGTTGGPQAGTPQSETPKAGNTGGQTSQSQTPQDKTSQNKTSQNRTPGNRTPGARTTPGTTGSANTRGTGRAGRAKPTAPRTAPARKPGITAPVLVVGGQFDATTPPEAARETALRTPSARFVEFAGVGHGVMFSSRCSQRTIAAFVDDPAASAPCDPAEPPRPMVRPDTILLTSSAYEIAKHPVLLIPMAGFALVSLLQLLLGLVALVRRRGDWLAVLGGLLGVAFTVLVVHSLRGFSVTALSIGLPKEVPWYGLIAVAAWLVSTVSAFRLRAHTFAIIPCLAGLAYITWMYGWLVA
ncbi:alpha/beta fold hydrolase [Planotetraspora kaengkrachanensis]|uniref:alpha/beta fold hydrolase n=1 Tax=Planotetraspora kaengkrachanensis TaxID=575193 RepID=UPI0019453428|nr:alpha/beta fold hydrolase [Planotetraspora kaengkrachanensis]